MPLDHAARANLEDVFKAKGDQGFRVLALATCRVSAKPDDDREDERGMVVRGSFVFLEPLKPEAREMIAKLARLGVAIVVFSGDNRIDKAHMADPWD